MTQWERSYSEITISTTIGATRGFGTPDGRAVLLHAAALLTGMRIGETCGWRSGGTPCAESVIRWRYGAAADCALQQND